MRRKAQTFMPDYLGSVAVFSVVVVIFLSSWNSVLSSQTAFSQEEEMRLQAGRTATFLVSTPGDPENWEGPSGVKVPGFASTDHVLDEDKLDEFGNLSYNTQRELLQAQDFNLTFRNSTHIIRSGGERLEYGRPYSGAETIVPVTRTVQLNLSSGMKTAEMKYVVWR